MAQERGAAVRRLLVLLAAALPAVVRGQCAAGERVHDGGCEACPEGKAGDGTSAECTPCAAGLYASGAALCVACPGGFVCPLAAPGDASAGTVKNQCTSGTASGGEGQIACANCSAGKYAQAGSPYIPAVPEACVVFCNVGYVAGTVDSPSDSCPAGCTLTPAVAARDAEPAACNGTATDDAYDCAAGFAAAAGTAESDCNAGSGHGCIYTPAVEAVDASDEVCAAASTADCGAGFTPGDEASCPNQGVPAGCVYIVAADAILAEPGASDCLDCPEGKSAAEERTELCSDCNAGMYSVVVPSRGATQCLTCEAGYMCAGGVARSQCTVGTHSAANASSCEDCPVGKYGTTVDGTRTCSECEPGQFTSSTAQLGCEQCPQAHRCPGGTQQRGCASGTYQPDPGQADCISCPSGQMAESLSTACEECPRGRYSQSMSRTCKTCPGGYMCAGNTDKVACGAGEYSLGRYPVHYTPDDASDDYTETYENANVAGPSLCQQCSAGMYTRVVSFRRSWDSFPEDWVCGGCDPGHECLRGSDKRICPAGKYAPAGSPECIDCPAGQYSSEGAGMCTTCEAGLYCPGKLLTSALRCCPAGSSVTPACPVTARTYPTEPAGICTREVPGGACASGVATDTCDGFGTGTCASRCQRVSSLLCIPGTFSVSGQTYCENCAPGQYSHAGNASCMPCTPGYFCAGGPVSEVAPRENNAAFSDTNLRISLHHANQQLAVPDILSSRQQCPNGTWSNNERLLAVGGETSVLAWCSNCSSGMFSGMGALSCENCTSGKFSKSGWPECQNCSRSSYCPGGTDEIQCPPGFFSEDGAVECIGCPAGKYTQPGSGFCVHCDQGFWCPGSTDKVPCSAGTWSNGTGASSRDACETCGIAAACLSGGRCRTGHRGEFCLGCQVDPSPWYKVEDLCTPCPTNTKLGMAIAGSMFLVFAIVMLRMGASGKTRSKAGTGNQVTVPFSILFTNLQIVMKFYELNLRWPQFVLDIVEQLGTFLELDFVSLSMVDPACSFQFENAGESYRFHQNMVLLMLPSFCLCIALLHLISSCLVSTLAMSGNMLKTYCYLIRGVPREVANACVTAFCTMFMGIAASALEAFHCTTRVKPQPHMDQHPNIMCEFNTGSYPMIFLVGLFMLIFYVLGFPVMMFITLFGRNRRWIPLDKENYVDPPNPFMSSCRSLTKFCKTCCLKTMLSPVLILTYLFQDRESVRLVEQEELRLAAQKKHEEKMEMQLETRMKGGYKQHILRKHKRVAFQALCNRRVDSGLHQPLGLSERMQGGKKAKKAALKAAREAEAAYKHDSDEEEKVVKKKIVKKPKRTGPLNSFSYKDNSFKDGTSKPKGAPIRSKSTRKLRADLLGPTSALKSASFADLHHAKVAEAKKKDGKSKRSNTITTKSWLEQEAEGETVAAKSFRERQKARSLQESAGDNKVKKANLKSESFQKRMARIKSGSIVSQGSFKDNRVVPESAAAKRAAAKLKEAEYARSWCGPKPPEYEVDEMETDGYIYWHDGTRQTLGWVYLRFRPDRWWFEFLFMFRKVAVLAVTAYLGNIGEGQVAWTAIAMITSVAFAAQWVLAPFPENRAARHTKVPCPGCSIDGLCSPQRGFFKCPARVLTAYFNPSLNDLELAGLTCQLLTLVCGLGCLIWGKDGAIDTSDTAEQVIFVLGIVSLCAILLFVVVVFIFWYKAVWNVIMTRRKRGQKSHISLSVGSAGIVDERGESISSENDDSVEASDGMSTPLSLDVEMAGNDTEVEQPGKLLATTQTDASGSKLAGGGSSKRGRKKKR